MTIKSGDKGQAWPRLDPIRTGIAGRCPRCGEGHLFDGFLTLRETCGSCGLRYDFADPADGPAFFVLCFTCIPAVIFAHWLQIRIAPPLWVHLVTTLPIVLATTLLPLRPLKGWLVCSQFLFKAGDVIWSTNAQGEPVAHQADRKDFSR
ncbi:MAG: DUF983 domain-containing protein [Pseudomonadota bacterium]